MDIDFIEEINKIIPTFPEESIDWDEVEKSSLGHFFPDMRKVQQNPVFHGEGDVLAHVKLVCEELLKMNAFYELPGLQRAELFAAAVLHDIGKIRTTCMEDSRWVSPHHSSTGSLMAREHLWRDWNLSGTRQKQQIRETICALIRNHMLPIHMLDRDDNGLWMRKTASTGELAPDFSWRLLCLLSEADIKGRIAADIGESVEKIELCRLMAEESGCLDGPFAFQDAYTRRAYFSGRNVQPDQILYDGTWGEVILMSGLPGTGKDTWIKTHAAELPVISLDEIRKEMNIRPTDVQGAVIQEATDRARKLLRRRQPFVWNATNITKDIRQKQVRLFEQYGAGVRIIYLETDRKTQLERNRNREAEVPEKAIDRMLAKTVPPMPEEAKIVEWICV